MGRFDPNNPRGTETKAKLGTADLLAALAPFQELCGEKTQEGARSHIEINMAAMPFDGSEFAVDELANRGLLCWIDHPPGARRGKIDGYGQTSSGGRLWVHMRRYAKESELADVRDANDWFCDLFDAVFQGLLVALSTSECPMVQQGVPVVESGPHREMLGEDAAQGSYMFATIGFDWGHAIGD